MAAKAASHARNLQSEWQQSPARSERPTWIVIQGVPVCGEFKPFRSPLILRVRCCPGSCEVMHEGLGIDVFSPSLGQLEADVRSQLKFLFAEYAAEEPEKLSAGGRRLRERLKYLIGTRFAKGTR